MKPTDKVVIDGTSYTREELELLQIEKLTEDELILLDYVTNEEFWGRYGDGHKETK